MQRLIEIPLVASTALGCVATGYLTALTAAALAPRRHRAGSGAGETQATTTFAILVPAHNEAQGIGATLASFAALDYPSERFSVHVVADNCIDDTADVVRASGWTAHERRAPDEPGKGPALNWLFHHLDRSTEFDVVVVVDADTVVAPHFLTALDRAFASAPTTTGRPVTVAQGFYGVIEPEASPATGIRYAALACRHHLRPLGRNRLQASAGLYGNGMAFRREVLRTNPWTGHLVEDAEMQLRLLTGVGTVVTYVPEARVEAEMPTSVDAATTQNARWERGRLELVQRFAGELARGVGTGRPKSRWIHLDALLDLLLPPLSVLVAARGATLIVNSTLGVTGSRQGRRRARVDAITLVLLGAHVVVGLRSVSAPPAVYRSLLSAPTAVMWKVGLWLKVLRPTSDVRWTRTRRNSER